MVKMHRLADLLKNFEAKHLEPVEFEAKSEKTCARYSISPHIQVLEYETLVLYAMRIHETNKILELVFADGKRIVVLWSEANHSHFCEKDQTHYLKKHIYDIFIAFIPLGLNLKNFIVWKDGSTTEAGKTEAGKIVYEEELNGSNHTSSLVVIRILDLSKIVLKTLIEEYLAKSLAKA